MIQKLFVHSDVSYNRSFIYIRVAEQMVEIRRLRPPRFLHTDGIVRPYIHLEAEGHNILQELEKGKFAKTDMYVAHVVVTANGKNILLVTNK